MRIWSGKSVYNSNVIRTIWNRRRIERKFNFLSFSIVFLLLIFVLNLIYSKAWKKERRMLGIEMKTQIWKKNDQQERTRDFRISSSPSNTALTWEKRTFRWSIISTNSNKIVDENHLNGKWKHQTNRKRKCPIYHSKNRFLACFKSISFFLRFHWMVFLRCCHLFL